ncbi:hypothetical protein PLIIFM63780_001217 [Purpureocillium lilacinum]|nr:hypothetical protein PLIIFM63780_001217 [Purpureocillium lilacinum]
MDRYRQTQSISALHYITIAVAATISANGGEGGKPEYRAPYMMPGVILLSFGVILYGWAAEYTLPWPVVDAGAAVFALGSIMVI